VDEEKIKNQKSKCKMKEKNSKRILFTFYSLKFFTLHHQKATGVNQWTNEEKYSEG